MDGSSPPTLGESRVRMSFNPSANQLVEEIKRKTADLIDLCGHQLSISQLNGVARNEQHRLYCLAQTHYEDAAMWAVKAATTTN